MLLIHGFNAGEGFGGGKGTWGGMPTLIKNLPLTTDIGDVSQAAASRFEPFEFQWRTDASFLEVGKDLAQAIESVYAQTGNRKVHLVAHSFGGVLARVVLQNLPAGTGDRRSDRLWASARSKVASLTTIGTPHSGISTADLSVDGVALPIGWNPLNFASLGCFQISCYETGAALSNPSDWAKAQLTRGGTSIAPNSPPSAGHITAALAKHVTAIDDNPLPQGIKLLALIGQTVPDGGDKFGTGDGLITYYGQRVEPGYSSVVSPTRLPLVSEGSYLGAMVSERILGLNAGVNAFPSDPIGTISRSGYMLSNAKWGYVHTGLFGFREAKINVEPEVEVPEACGTVAKACQQDAWANIWQFLLSQHGGPASDSFPNTTGSSLLRVAAATCSSPVVGSAMTCTLTGSALPSGIQLSSTNCSPAALAELVGGTEASRQFSCTPIAQGVAVEVTATVPGLSGTFPILPIQIAGGSVLDAPPANFVELLNDQFNDGVDDVLAWDFHPWNCCGGATAHSEVNGALEIRMDRTDVGGQILTSLLGLGNNTEIWIRLRQRITAGFSEFFPTISLRASRAADARSISIGPVRNSYQPDLFSCNTINRLIAGVNFGSKCFANTSGSGANSTDLFGRWMTTTIYYSSTTGILTADYDGDGVIDFETTVPVAERTNVGAVSMSTYGWFTGHKVEIDSISIWGH